MGRSEVLSSVVKWSGSLGNRVSTINLFVGVLIWLPKHYKRSRAQVYWDLHKTS